MRPGQNRRVRGRNRSKGPNPLTRTYESNGPDVKIRGTAQHVADKYAQLARDAQASGDPVSAENYLQHAEHYYRLIAAAQEALRQQFPGQFQRPFDDEGDEGDEDGMGANGDEYGEAPYGNGQGAPYEGRGNGERPIQQPRFDNREGRQDGRQEGRGQDGRGQDGRGSEGRGEFRGEPRGDRQPRSDRNGGGNYGGGERFDRNGDRPDRNGGGERQDRNGGGERYDRQNGGQAAQGQGGERREGRERFNGGRDGNRRDFGRNERGGGDRPYNDRDRFNGDRPQGQPRNEGRSEGGRFNAEDEEREETGGNLPAFLTTPVPVRAPVSAPEEDIRADQGSDAPSYAAEGDEAPLNDEAAARPRRRRTRRTVIDTGADAPSDTETPVE